MLNNLPICDKYEVIVAGGGPSGITAAVASAREGKKTLLLERSGHLGGMAISAMVPAWTPFTDGVRIIYGGLAKKILLETKNHMPHVPEDQFDWVPIDYDLLGAVYENMLAEYGVEVLFHSTVCDVIMKDERHVESLVVANKAGLTAYQAPIFVDCTGDADIYAFSGGEFEIGDKGNVQPSTMCFIISNVDEELYFAGPSVSGGNPDSVIHKILADGKYNIPDNHICIAHTGPSTFSFNAGHLWQIHSTDPEELSKGILAGRAMAREFAAALKEYHPAFANSHLVMSAPTLGTRESRRIVGDYVFTREDYFARRSFPDEIARNCYYLDVHRSTPEENIQWTNDPSTRWEQFHDGESHGIPYGCLCPKQLDNVLVAGRTVSTDRISQGSLRVMPCCLCEGEAAGVAAALAVDMNVPNIHEVNTDRLREILKANDAYLPDMD